MTAATRVPDLPSVFVNTEDEFLQLFVPLVKDSHTNLVEDSAKYETLREAESRADSALETSEHEDAVAFRAIAETVAETVEALQSERDEQIKAIRASFKAKIDDANNSIKAERDRVLKLIAADTVSDIDVTELVANYTKHLEVIKSTAKAVKDHSPELFEYAKTLPSKVAQATGGNVTTGTRGPTPRLSSVTVVNPDGTVAELTPATLGEAAKHTNTHAGVKSVTRKALAAQMLGVAGPGAINLSTDPDNPTVFYFIVNEKSYKYLVVAKVKTANDADDDSE